MIGLLLSLLLQAFLAIHYPLGLASSLLLSVFWPAKLRRLLDLHIVWNNTVEVLRR